MQGLRPYTCRCFRMPWWTFVGLPCPSCGHQIPGKAGRFWCNLGRWDAPTVYQNNVICMVNNHKLSPIYTVTMSYYSLLLYYFARWLKMLNSDGRWLTWPISFSIASLERKVGGLSIPFAEFPGNVEAGFTNQWTLILFIWLLRLTCTRRGCHWQSQSAECQMPIPCQDIKKNHPVSGQPLQV